MPRIAGDGVELAVLDEGEGMPVLLLHGFPDSSQVWRNQIPALIGAGMRAIAPDLRGFGGSDRPDDVEQYGIGRSVADMLAMLDALDVEVAHVVGHDWGAAVAWVFASLHPGRVGRLAALSVGHPNTLGERTIEQRQKAWYQLLFQFEDVAEELLARDDWRLCRELLDGAADTDRYIADLSRPGALTAGLNWYRANAHPRNELRNRPPLPAVAAPTLALWSTGDLYLTEDRVLRSAEHVTGPWRYERVEDAGHWLQLDAPERVNQLLLESLA